MKIICRQFLHYLIILTFVSSLTGPCPQARAESLLNLPEPGRMVDLSRAYEPVLLKGLKAHPENPFLMDFVIDTGDTGLTAGSPALREESRKLVKYFLAAFTVPERDLWVNLSPYEKNRLIASNLAQTDMGRDMLAQDYILKQLTASLIYPETQIGKTFWDEVYGKARELYGTTQIPVNTFNKVWIVADRADVLERDHTAYVVGAHLKVMLEEDYLALTKHQAPQSGASSSLGSRIIRSVVLPELEKEVNTGRNFASLRQMFYAMVLASWYKAALKESILAQIYGNKAKVTVGINQEDPALNEEIFKRYVQAYKRGVFNYIKEGVDPSSAQLVPRRYFSGGTNFAMLAQGGILRRIKDPLTMPAADTPAVTGILCDASFRIDPAMAAIPRHSNHLTTVVRLSKKDNGLGMPEVRYTRVSTLTVGPEEERNFFNGVLDNRNIVLLTEEAIEQAREGNVKVRLTPELGIVPQKFVGRKALLSRSVVEILEGFQSGPQELPRDLKESANVAFRVNEVFRVRVHDRANDRYLYFLVFNPKSIEQGELRLSALGGGVRFKRGGLAYYKKYVDARIKTLPDESPENVRVVIRGSKLEAMIQKVNQGAYIENNVDHELEEELNSENGLFPAGVPPQWLASANGGPRVKPIGDGTMQVSISSNGKGTQVQMLIPDSLAFDPRTTVLLKRIKGLASDSAMSSDGGGRQRLTFRIRESVEKVRSFLNFLPWEKQSARALLLGLAGFSVVAVFKHIPDQIVTVLDMVLVGFILQLELLERQEKRFMADHDYYVKVLKTFYDRGSFTNGHSSRELVRFYMRYYRDFVENLDDDDEEATLEMIAGTLTAQEAAVLRAKKSKVKFEERLLWAMDRRDEKKVEFMKIHETYLSGLKPGREDGKTVSNTVKNALKFYVNHDAEFSFFLTRPQQEEAAGLLARDLPKAQNKLILRQGQNQQAAIQRLMYWELLQSDATEKTAPAPGSPDKAMKAPSNPGGIDLSAARMQMRTQRSPSPAPLDDDGAVRFRLDPLLLQQLQSLPGFVPVIINIRPVTNLKALLGLDIAPLHLPR